MKWKSEMRNRYCDAVVATPNTTSKAKAKEGEEDGCIRMCVIKIGKKETCSIVSRRKSRVSEKTTVTVVLPHVFSYWRRLRHLVPVALWVCLLLPSLFVSSFFLVHTVRPVEKNIHLKFKLTVSLLVHEQRVSAEHTYMHTNITLLLCKNSTTTQASLPEQRTSVLKATLTGLWVKFAYFVHHLSMEIVIRITYFELAHDSPLL